MLQKMKERNFWKANVITRKIYSYLEYRHVKFDYLLGAKKLFFRMQPNIFVHIHNLKYDEYLRSKEEERVVEYKYIFIYGCRAGTFTGSIREKLIQLTKLST